MRDLMQHKEEHRMISQSRSQGTTDLDPIPMGLDLQSKDESGEDDDSAAGGAGRSKGCR